MKVIILSAGQGTRLLPLTADRPKCLIPVQGKTVLEWQIDELHRSGIDDITVVVGYNAPMVEELLADRYGPGRVHTRCNADYASTDNLVSCWLVRDLMDEDFILLNGDTLFTGGIVERLLAAPAAPVTVTVHCKAAYDADDMKVSLDGDRLLHVSKDIPLAEVHGESIGMILFRGEGPALFREGLERARADRACNWRWFLSVIDQLAGSGVVRTCLTGGLPWCEIDYPADLDVARQVMADHCRAGNRTVVQHT